MTLQEAAEERYPDSEHPLKDAIRHFQQIAFIAGANYILENGWVSVKDALPEIPPPYYDERFDADLIPCSINVLVWDGEYVSEKSFGILKWDEEITHWQPLPKPPQKQ